MITLGGLVLFGIFLLSTNSIILNQSDIAVSNEFYISAIGLGQSLIDEAKGKKFDEAAVAGTLNAIGNLTDPSSLGRETGETYTTPDSSWTGSFRSLTAFDDFDDYNNYTRMVSTPRADKFSITSRIGYVSETWPDSTKTVRTFAKKMTVTVSSPYLSNTVVLEYLFIY